MALHRRAVPASYLEHEKATRPDGRRCPGLVMALRERWTLAFEQAGEVRAHQVVLTRSIDH